MSAFCACITVCRNGGRQCGKGKFLSVYRLRAVSLLLENPQGKMEGRTQNYNGSPEYPTTLYHYCFHWSEFFEERSRTQKMLFLFNEMQISGRVFCS